MRILSQQLLGRGDFPEILQQVVQRILLRAAANGVLVFQQQLMRVHDLADRDEDGGFGERSGIGELIHVEIDFRFFDFAGASEKSLHLLVGLHNVRVEAGQVGRITTESLVAGDELTEGWFERWDE